MNWRRRKPMPPRIPRELLDICNEELTQAHVRFVLRARNRWPETSLPMLSAAMIAACETSIEAAELALLPPCLQPLGDREKAERRARELMVEAAAMLELPVPAEFKERP